MFDDQVHKGINVNKEIVAQLNRRIKHLSCQINSNKKIFNQEVHKNIEEINKKKALIESLHFEKNDIETKLELRENKLNLLESKVAKSWKYYKSL